MADPTPINVAEAVVEPFWDPALSGLDEWTVEAAPGSGAGARQNWCWAALEWAAAPDDGPVLELERTLDVDCAAYDRLLVSAVLPEGSTLRVETETDVGRRRHGTVPSDGEKREYAVPLDGARHVDRIALAVLPDGEGRGEGWLNWIGLQDPDLLERHLAQFDRFDARWADHLEPPEYDPDFEPTTGLLLDAGEVAALRERHAAGDGLLDDVIAEAREAAGRTPEDRIGEFLAGGGDRYTRVRDAEGRLGPSDLRAAVTAAVGGLVLEDADLHRLAARYAMSAAAAARWDEGFVSRFPGSAWAHRSFLPSMVLHSVALVLDLAGEWFTDAGRQFLRRRLVEDGLDTVTYDTWRYDYVFENNQLAWFSHGRLAALAHLESEWPRAEPYTDVAREELCRSVDEVVLDDGGFVEGPSYFATVVSHGGRGLYYYARARDAAFADVLPAAFERTDAFGAALASTDERQDVVPICDGHARLPHDALAMLATLDPDGVWARLLRGAVERSGGAVEDALAARLVDDLDLDSEEPPALPAFVRLPEMGVAASVREHAGEPVKLFVMGNRAGAGHTHEDKGSFVLEFAGQTFAMDPGTADYGRPLANRLKHCERHNVLVPRGTDADGRPAPENPLPHDVKPAAEGDGEAFEASVDATPGWDAYERWERSWASPDPGTLRVTDEWALADGDGVDCYWQVPADVEVTVEDGGVVLRGRRGRVVLDAPADARIETAAVEMPGEPATRVAFRYDGRSGEATVTARLHAAGE